MNSLRQSIFILAAGALLACSSSALAQATVYTTSQGQAKGSQTITVTESAGGEPRTIEIRVDGDQVKVIRDGQEVPNAKITHDEDGIVILDQDGKHLQKLNVRWQPLEVAGRYRAAQEAYRSWGGFEQGDVPKVMLGVHMGEPGAPLCKHLQLQEGTATLITGVFEGLPAHEAGIGEYDIIIKVNGKSPANAESIRNVIKEANPGESLAFTVIQSGKPKDVKVKLIEYDAKAMGEAKLIGQAPPGGFLSAYTTRADGAEFFPQMKGQSLFVVPQGEVREYVEAMKPRLELLREYGHDAMREGRESLNERLKQLDERMADLERLLERLVERERSR